MVNAVVVCWWVVGSLPAVTTVGRWTITLTAASVWSVCLALVYLGVIPFVGILIGVMIIISIVLPIVEARLHLLVWRILFSLDYSDRVAKLWLFLHFRLRHFPSFCDLPRLFQGVRIFPE